MRFLTVSLALALVACAGQPTAHPLATRTKFVSNADMVGTADNGTSIDKVVLDARKQGYTVVDENGETMFCHKAARTGSHLATETTCMTAKQMADLREQTQRNLQNFQMQMPPPQGK